MIPESEQNQRIQQIAGHLEQIITLLGEDPRREGLRKTPVRAAKALWYATSGYRQDPAEAIRQAMFEHEGSKIITVRDIEFYSMCEHHILPFFGKISVGYIPNGKIIGLSKLARVVDAYARRLQVQERLTAEVCNEIAITAGAKGVMVVCQAEHLCMKMRGVEKQDASTTTIEYCGEFANDPSLRAEFLAQVGLHN